eukprot:11228365-Lingulodinium_polyedra.AAC.3
MPPAGEASPGSASGLPAPSPAACSGCPPPQPGQRGQPALHCLEPPPRQRPGLQRSPRHQCPADRADSGQPGQYQSGGGGVAALLVPGGVARLVG